MKENIIKEKSFQFAIDVIHLFNNLKEQKEYVLSKQLLWSGTSIGANVQEAMQAQSKADFISKMSISLKEAQETEYWLMLYRESKMCNFDYQYYIFKIAEIKKILSSIIKTSKETNN